MSGGYSCPRHVYCGLSPGDALITATRHVTPRSHERNSEILAEISDHGCVEPGSSMSGTGRRTDQGQSIPGQKPAVYDYSYPWLNPLPSEFLALLCRTIFKSFFRDAGGASSLSSSRLQINKRWTGQRPQFAPLPPLMHATLPRWHGTDAWKVQGYRPLAADTSDNNPQTVQRCELNGFRE
jgi:hypothetical protein